jgi:phage portal protein BeeE
MENQDNRSPLSDFHLYDEAEAKARISKELALQKALASSDVDAIYKAQRYLENIQKAKETQSKTLLIDPYVTNGTQGYREKPPRLSFDLLRGMARTSLIKAIISTRKDQVREFCKPQANRYSPGFILAKKRSFLEHNSEDKELTRAERAALDKVYEFILNCGNGNNSWSHDSFETFIDKIIDDSLTIDQGCAEIVRNFKGEIVEFFAVDGATIRRADPLSDKYKEQKMNGYQVSHVQVYEGNVVAEYYPWDLMFGIRNASSDMKSYGYGRAELEDMIQQVTALLNSDTYNANFFRVGSAPKGLLKYSGNINQNTVEEFRRQWMAQLSGAVNMHKIPIINADKMDFVNLQQSNKDMEFSKYLEFLIKVCCAMFKIDPSEIGFPMSGASDSKPMFEGSNEARLKYSRDKGLTPLLKALEGWINKWIVNAVAPDFEFRFVGYAGEDEQTELERDIKKLGAFMTFNEIRKKYNLKEIDGMDVIGNSLVLQLIQIKNQQEQQEKMEQQMAQQEQMGDDEDYGDDEDGDEDDWYNSDSEGEDDEEDPFEKALMNDLPRLFG